MERVELHLHTNYSALDGVSDIREYIRKAEEYNFTSLAVTDYISLQSFIDANLFSKRNNIKIIYGCEFIDNDDNHIVVLVKSKKGLEQLYQLILLSSFHKDKTISKDKFELFHSDSLFGSACLNGEVFKHALSKDIEELKESIQFFDYIEIQPVDSYLVLGISKEEIIDTIKLIISTAKELGKIVVATGNAHYVNKEDKIKRDVILPLNKNDSTDSNLDLHFRSTEEMLNCFSFLGEELAYELVVTNTNLISDSIEEIEIVDDKFVPLQYRDADILLEEVCNKNLKELYGDNPDKRIMDRYNTELSIIKEKGYESILYVYYLVINKCKEDGFFYSTRGSVSSLFVSYLLRKEGINPLKPHYYCPICKRIEWVDEEYVGYDLNKKKCPLCNKEMITDGFDIPFETFLGLDGEKTVDIDINFDIDYQSNAQEYLKDILKSNNQVLYGGTINYVSDRQYKELYSSYIEKNNLTNQYLDNIPHIKRMDSIHPGGMFVIPKEYKIPVVMYNKHLATHYETAGLLNKFSKFDLLGHIVPNRIKHLEELTGIKYSSIDISDNTLKDILLNKTDISTLGIDDFDTKAIKDLIKKTNPSTFNDLIKLQGFVHGTNVYLFNNDKLLRNGYSLNQLFSLRDDIYNYLIDNGIDRTLSYKIMEDVRKGKGLKEEYKELLLDNNLDNNLINSLDRFKYMFPKAHALEYIRLSLILAYYKLNYPLEFYIDYLSTFGNNVKRAIERLPNTITIKMIEYRIDELKEDDSLINRDYIGILSTLLEALDKGYKVINNTINKENKDTTITCKNNSIIIE